MQVNQRGHRDARRPDLHVRAGSGVKHPGRESDHHARRNLNVNEPAADALLAALLPKSAPVQGMPTVVDLDFLPDMGRMTG